MRVLSLVTMVCLSASLARADEVKLTLPVSMLSRTMAEPVREQLSDQADHDIETGRGMMVSGIVLSLLGTAMTIAGPVSMFYSPCKEGCNGSFMTGSITMSTLGPISIVTGIPLWAAGGSRMHHARRARVALTANGFAF